MRGNSIIIALILFSVVFAADCDNDFVLSPDDVKEFGGSTFKLIDSGTSFDDIELKIDGEEVDFDKRYAVEEDWFVRVISVLPNAVHFTVSEFENEREGDEFVMNDCDKSAVEVRDQDIFFLPSTYYAIYLVINDEEITIDAAGPGIEYFEDHLIKIDPEERTIDKGTEEVSLQFIKLRTQKVELDEQFTLRLDSRARAKLGSHSIKMLPTDQENGIIFDDNVVYGLKGQSIPINDDYEFTIVSANKKAKPAEIKLIISKRPEYVPTATPEPTPTPTITPPPSATPEPTPSVTPEPTVTPEPNVTSKPTKSPTTGLVSFGFFDNLVNWFEYLFGL